MNMRDRIDQISPKTGMRSIGSLFWIAVPLLIAVWVGKEIAAGFILGTLVVFGMMLTIEQIPGFWHLARTGWGRLVVAVGTGYITHRIFSGSDAIIVVVATAWSAALKALILTFEGRRLNAMRNERLAHAHAYMQRDKRVIDSEFVR